MHQQIAAFSLVVTATAWALSGFGLTSTLIMLLMALWLTRLAHRLETTTRALRDTESRGGQVQQDLAAAKEAAEARDRSKSAFLATMSHESARRWTAWSGWRRCCSKRT